MSVSDHSREHGEPNAQSSSKQILGSLRNGLIGGAVAVVLTVLPLSEVLGGGVTGYLERGAGRRGTLAGTIAGLVAFAPYVVVAGYLVMSPGVALPGPDLGLSRELLIVGVAGVALVYVVGLSVLGSVLGGYLRDEQ